MLCLIRLLSYKECVQRSVTYWCCWESKQHEVKRCHATSHVEIEILKNIFRLNVVEAEASEMWRSAYRRFMLSFVTPPLSPYLLALRHVLSCPSFSSSFYSFNLSIPPSLPPPLSLLFPPILIHLILYYLTSYLLSASLHNHTILAI